MSRSSEISESTQTTVAARNGSLGLSAKAPARRRFAFVWRLRRIARAVVGFFSLLLGLVVCSSVPIVQFLALGYLLRSSGRLARSGRLRSAFPGVKTATRMGSFVIAVWLLAFGLSILFGLSRDAELIDAGSASTRWISIGTAAVTVAIAAQIVVAFLRGVEWSYIFRPVSNLRWLCTDGMRGSWYRGQLAAGAAELRSLQLVDLLRLGVVAYLGSWLWLLPPSLLLVGGQGEGLFRVLGIAGLAYSVTMLPVIQTRFAVDGRWRVFLEWRAARTLWARAPIALFLATLVWLALGLIPYVFLIEAFPYGLLWIPSLVFVATTVPSRLGMAWCIRHARRRDRNAGPWFRWPLNLLAYTAGLIFSTLVFYSPYVVFRGSWILLDHPTFLFPILK